MKRIFPVFISILLMVSLSGCGPSAQVFGDLQMNVPDEFHNMSDQEFAKDADFLFGWDTLIVKGMAEKKSDLRTMTLEEYTQLLITGNALNCSATVGGNGYRFVYRAAVGERSYTYFSATYEGKENFWSVQCYCPSEDFAKHQAAMEELLNSVATDLPFTGA